MIWEVFRQERKGQPFTHGGSFHAPDQAFADAYAREFYARRQESVALWVVHNWRRQRAPANAKSPLAAVCAIGPPCARS